MVVVKQLMDSFIEKIFPTIKVKVLLAFFVLIFTPLVILTTITYNIVSTSYEEQIVHAADQSFDQAHQFITYKLDALIRSSDIVYLNNEIQAILARDMAVIEGDMIQQYKDSLYLDNLLYSIKTSEDVFRIKLYVSDYLFYAGENENYGGLYEFMLTDKYDILSESTDKVVWFKPENVLDAGYENEVSVVTVLRKVNNVEKISEFNGIIEIQMLEARLEEIITKADITSRGVVLIRNSRDELISTSDTNKLKEIGLGALDISFLDSDAISHTWFQQEISDELYSVRVESIDDTDWELIAIVPYSEILEQGRQIRLIMMVLLLLLGVIAYTIAYLLTENVTGRIRHLSDTMVDVQGGNMDAYAYSNQSDEIGQLYASFNYMLKRINHLVEQQYEDGKNIKSAELKALQAQINPHFLYNTLDLINWKAMEQGDKDIAQIARALAKFYKLSLNKGRDMVSLEDELSHVEQYVKIQNMRFDNRIQYECLVDKGVQGYQVPKIILQPIVENAIVHGILKKRQQDGCITIEGHVEKGDLILTISDDGLGIEPDILHTILLDTATRESHGYGIKNIHDRLKLHYGNEYGLAYQSELGKGTTVTVKLPAVAIL